MGNLSTFVITGIRCSGVRLYSRDWPDNELKKCTFLSKSYAEEGKEGAKALSSRPFAAHRHSIYRFYDIVSNIVDRKLGKHFAPRASTTKNSGRWGTRKRRNGWSNECVVAIFRNPACFFCADFESPFFYRFRIDQIDFKCPVLVFDVFSFFRKKSPNIRRR